MDAHPQAVLSIIPFPPFQIETQEIRGRPETRETRETLEALGILETLGTLEALETLETRGIGAVRHHEG